MEWSSVHVMRHASPRSPLSRRRRPGTTLRAKAAAAIALIIVILASGCGSTPSTPTEQRARPAEFKTPRDLLITREDIAHEKRAPAAAILRWWQALQFQDVATAANVYAPKVRRTRLREQMRELSAFLTASRPQIEDADVTGKKARVLATVQWVSFASSGTRIVELPVTFYLVRERGTWKLADNNFLVYRLQLQRGPTSASRESGGRKSP